MQKYHFISGLPRSGSTLLSSILKQNPRFYSSITDPLHSYSRSIIQTTHASAGMEMIVPVAKRAHIIRGLFYSFYEGKPEICFNTNRSWAAETSLIKNLFPYSKIIICIRDIPWILDSFERLNQKNPFTIKPLYHHKDLPSVYERTHTLMSPEGGYVYGPTTTFKQGLFSDDKDMLCIVEYDALVKDPAKTMFEIYNFIGEPWFDHDFDNVEDSYDEFDQQTNIIGLHTVRKKIEYQVRKPILPLDLWQMYAPYTFWKQDFDYIKGQIKWIS